MMDVHHIETHQIEAEGISATISAEGAELVGLRNGADEEFLWQAGPEWPRHAPVLFPIVGRLAGDRLHHEGRDHRLTQHGFARDRRFEWVERSPARAVLRLEDDAATRALYPFPFRLEMTYAAEAGTLSVSAAITNPGDGMLPFSIGAHPAFRWPLKPGTPKTRHRIVFEQPEPGSRRMVVEGLLGDPVPLPFEGRVLPLDPALFADDALVMPGVASRSLRYEALGEDGEAVAALDFAFEGYGDLGLWSKPTGADFLCIEPWRGMASPRGWDGPFTEKPGLVHLAPRASAAFLWWVRLPAG
jgi:galactose mutarotase-like enzyme